MNSLIALKPKDSTVYAIQWWENGDHPDDGPKEREGQVVRYFRNLEIPSDMECPYCRTTMHHHGWIDNNDQIVCPGNYVIQTSSGAYLSLNYDRLVELFEVVEDESQRTD